MQTTLSLRRLRVLRPAVPARAGVTVIELLVTLAVIGILVALAIPAVQAARESSRRSTCLSNLRELGIATHNFHDTQRRLPASTKPSATNPESLGAFVQLLPFLDQKGLWDKYRKTERWNHPHNVESVTRVQLRTFECRSAPNSGRLDGDPMNVQTLGPGAWQPNLVAVSDYAASLGVDPRLSAVNPAIPCGPGALSSEEPGKLMDLSDGLGSTILFVESAGRPFLFRRGVGQVSADQVQHRVNGGGWGRPASDMLFAGSNRAGTIVPPASTANAWAVNATNGDDVGGEAYPHPYYGTLGTSQPFAFHATGANVLFADGSARLIDEGVEIGIFAALVTREGGEKLSDRDY